MRLRPAGCSRGGRAAAGMVLCLMAAAACTDATDVELLEITASGSVAGQVYLDLNGSGANDPGDEPLAGATVRLSSTGGTIVEEATTNPDGLFVFERVPVGSYRVAVSSALLGDSLEVIEDPGTVAVVLQDPVEAVLGLSFPELSIEEVRASVPGRRVFTTGIALNPRQPFSEGLVFLKGEASYLQAVDVERTPAVSVGDSVRFLGRTARADGRAALTEVTPIILVGQAEVPLPLEVSTANAAAAAGGSIDAALVSVREVTVSGPGSQDGNFHFLADDGSGPVEVVLRSFLGFTAAPVDGAELARVVGMLAPYDDGSGNVRWRLLVRALSELVPAP